MRRPKRPPNLLSLREGMVMRKTERARLASRAVSRGRKRPELARDDL
jgi:hypothetical protein